MTPKLVRGTPVISLADGAAVGVVDHVYLDRERLASSASPSATAAACSAAGRRD